MAVKGHKPLIAGAQVTSGSTKRLSPKSAALSPRRSMLGAAVSEIGIGASPRGATAPSATTATRRTAATSDAALLALCGEFHHYQAAIDKWNEDDDVEWDVGDAANVKWWAALRQIVDTPAQTMEGIKAKAIVLIFTVPGITASPEIDGELGLLLAADIAAMGAVA